MTGQPHRLFAAISDALRAVRRAFTPTRKTDGMLGGETDTTLFGSLSEQPGPSLGPVRNEFWEGSGESGYVDVDGIRAKGRTTPRR